MFRIVSGGQSGVDRAALDFAIEHKFPYSGWVPLGGWAEDLPEPPGLLALYPELREAPSKDPVVRTRLNAFSCDAALTIFSNEDTGVSAGTGAGLRVVEVCRKPSLVVSLNDPAAAGHAIRFFANTRTVSKVMIGGPRESESPGIYRATRDFLAECLSPTAKQSPSFWTLMGV